MENHESDSHVDTGVSNGVPRGLDLMQQSATSDASCAKQDGIGTVSGLDLRQ